MAITAQLLKESPAASRPGAEAARSISLDNARRLTVFVGVFRVTVAAAMLLAALLFPDPPVLGTRAPELFASTASTYLLVGAVLLAWQRRHPARGSLAIAGPLAMDLTAVLLLMYASGGIPSGIGALLVVFVGAASLTLTGRYAFLAAALTSLAILAAQWAGYVPPPRNSSLPGCWGRLSS
jgi:hypothetical protein